MSRNKMRRAIMLAPLLALANGLVGCAPTSRAAGTIETDVSSREISARAAVEEALACWARGMDLTLEGEADAALATWTDCYTHPNYVFRVHFRGQTIEGHGAIGRAETNVSTGAMFGYVGAYHFISNVEVEMVGQDAATATALQTADHFRDDGTMERTYGIITVEFVREADGWWLAVDETMDIQRMIGFATQPAPAALTQQ